MNRYGAQAMRHGTDAHPERLREMDDPQEFFTQLGNDISQAIE